MCSWSTCSWYSSESISGSILKGICTRIQCGVIKFKLVNLADHSRRAPEPIEMNISLVESHCSRVVTLCHESRRSAQKRKVDLFFSIWRSGKKTEKKVRNAIVLARVGECDNLRDNFALFRAPNGP